VPGVAASAGGGFVTVFDFGRQTSTAKGPPHRITVHNDDLEQMLAEVKVVRVGSLAYGIDLVANRFMPRGKALVTDRHGNVLWVGNLKEDAE